MATGKNFSGMPFQLTSSRQPVALEHRSDPIALCCPYSGIRIESGLFKPPVVLHGNGYFAISAANLTASRKQLSANGTVRLRNSAASQSGKVSTAYAEIQAAGDADLVYYTKASAVGGAMRLYGQPATTKRYFALSASAMIQLNGSGATRVHRSGAASGQIELQGQTQSAKCSAVHSGSGFLCTGTLQTVMYGYEHYIPADASDSLLDADGELFVTRRNGDNGI